jgi:2-dehydro-3-deoxygluconokinase
MPIHPGSPGSALQVPSGDGREFDAVALGEVMLRLDPGEHRIRSARTFEVSEGGGEYNVIRSLSRVFGMRTAIVTAIARSEVGRLLESLILQGGVDPRYIVWRKYDGIGRRHRNSINFTERGFGLRGAVGVSDRAHSATGSLRPEDVDWDELFDVRRARWFHTGGVFAGLSGTTAPVAAAAMAAARHAGTVVSYDLNYRPSMWDDQGGEARAREINRALVAEADVLIGNEEEFTKALGFTVPDLNATYSALDPHQFEQMLGEVIRAFPNLKIVATTLREVHDASSNDWGAIAWSAADGFVRAPVRTDIPILDRVGGGDSFVSGLAFGLLTGTCLQRAVELGAAHGALAMTTPGDTSQASLEEVERLANGGTARVVR